MTETLTTADKTSFCQLPKQPKSAKGIFLDHTNPIATHSEEFLRHSYGKSQFFCPRQQRPKLCRSK